MGRRRTIDRRLSLAITATSGVSLLVACCAFIVYETGAGRTELAEKSEMLASVVGTNSAVAITFDDAPAAEETLGALVAVDEVVAAVLYDESGSPFATYRSEESGDFEAPPVGDDGSRFVDAGLEVVQPVLFQDRRVGTIRLLLDTSALVARAETYLLIVLALIGAAGVVSGVMARRLRGQIAEPLSDLVSHTAAVTEGDLAQPLAKTSDDEIGELVDAFNEMTGGLRGLVLQVRQSIGEVSEVSSTLEDRSRVLEEQAQRQRSAVAESGRSMEQVGSSIAEVNGNVERLAAASRETSTSIVELDAAIAEIASHMDHLTGAIETTSSSVSQVTGSISEVVNRATSLGSASEDTATALVELAASVAAVKGNAAESLALSEESSREAGDGMAAVRETIDAMGQIRSSFEVLQGNVGQLADRSASIEEIVQVITDVADESALLSLNAAIIAAQAGPQGKAFSVVAEQVKSLAARTRHSAQEIAELIRAVQKDTQDAVNAMQEGSTKVGLGVQRSNVAGEVLARINEKARSSTERVRWIVNATEQQSLDLDQVDRALDAVRQLVDQIGTSSREQKLAADEIARSVENIRELGAGVRKSTEEQRRGSALITRAASNVTAMANQIAEATGAQARSAETVRTSLHVFTDVTEETAHGAEAIYASVAVLLERASRLESEIGRFKTEE